MKNSKKTRGNAEADIRRRILQAIFEQRMPPGERLTEELMAETFGVSRTVIRQVMARLAQDGILVKQPNGGTRVAAPTRKEVLQILAVRRMIEPEIVKAVASSGAELSLDRLFEHLGEEDAVRRSGDRGALVRLTGEFHLHLAELAGNPILVRLMTELQALTCLAILLYAGSDDACPPDEHRKIVDSIQNRDADSAVRFMLEHLHHVQKDMKLEDARQEVTFSETLDWMRAERRRHQPASS
jgi:DNA-binding GntR family transcriptional regulator